MNVLTFNKFKNPVIKSEKILTGLILDSIPKNYINMYPLARNMNRHFILHVGETNTGKTHQALQRMKAAEYGVYLAPLRLLAHEVYLKIIDENIPCNMITGEEEILTQNAKHLSSTIEMLRLEKHYDVVVIDEAQMISDPIRGGAWTEAIVGALADEIHVCMSPDALNLIISVVKACGDTYEVVEHIRNTKLLMDDKPFHFPEDVCSGDALIVFSKRSVLYVAAELQKKCISCSIIYGSLPYSVRESEMAKFQNKETSVVVATDAIGMGINLPIKRIVFLEVEKFDGSSRRQLNPTEIKQIAGRAGRKEIYDIGYWTSEYNKDALTKAFTMEQPSLHTAFIHFPEILLNIDSPVSAIIQEWAKVSNKNPFKQANLKETLMLCQIAEKSINDHHMIYKLATIPFNISNDKLLQEWNNIVFYVSENYIAVPEKPYIPFGQSSDDLTQLEYVVAYCDLYLYYMRRIAGIKNVDEITEWKNEAISRIQNILKDHALLRRGCKKCGTILPWNFPHTICNNCYELWFH